MIKNNNQLINIVKKIDNQTTILLLENQNKLVSNLLFIAILVILIILIILMFIVKGDLLNNMYFTHENLSRFERYSNTVVDIYRILLPFIFPAFIIKYSFDAWSNYKTIRELKL